MQTHSITMSRGLIVDAIAEIIQHRLRKIPENEEIQNILFSDWKTMSGLFGGTGSSAEDPVVMKVLTKRDQEVNARIYNG